MLDAQVRRSLLAGLALFSLAGCTPPEEELDSFVERYEAQYPPIVVEGCSGDVCMPPAAGEADGQYLFTLSASLNPALPVLFDMQLAFDGSNLTMTVQALSAMDRQTKVGTSTDLGPFAVGGDGCFEADLPPLTVVGEANAISGQEIQADVTLTGRLCGGETFICGGLIGDLLQPFMFDLMGSTFTFEKTAMPDVYTEPPVINCAGETGDPL